MWCELSSESVDLIQHSTAKRSKSCMPEKDHCIMTKCLGQSMGQRVVKRKRVAMNRERSRGSCGKKALNRQIFIVGYLIIIIIIFTAIGLLPSGSGCFTCKQNMKLVTNKFKSGGLHERHVVATWNLENNLSIWF